MATVTKGRTFVSGETVTPAKLNELVDNATVTSIQTADISDAAVTNAKIASGVDASKLTTGTLPADRIGSDAITTARINNAAVTAAKLDGAQTGSAPIYGCRAWVNFDGTRDSTGASSTAATNRFIRASGNVTSVLRNGDGDYTITFTTAMPDTNYCVLGTTCTPTTVARGGATVGIREFDDGSGSAITTSTLRISVRAGSTDVDAGLNTNRRNICVSVFR